MTTANEPLAADDPAAARTRTLVLAATILASALAFIDGSVVNIAVPVLQAELGASFRETQWILNAYALTLGSLVLVTGGLGDRIGRRKVFITGIVIFAVSSLVCALAPNAVTLIAARAVQGIGAGLLIPQSLAIISATFPRSVRGKAIGTWAAASSITTSLGPPLGGLLVDYLSWRAAFWVNLPLAAIAVWLAWTAMPESREPGAKGRLDIVGAVLAMASFGAVTFGITAFTEGVPAEAGPYVAIGGGLVGLVLFVLWERRAANPVVPMSLFRSRVFTGANIMTVFLYGCLAAILFLIPFDLIVGRDLSAAQAGLVVMPVGIIIGLFSRRVGAWADRVGPRPFLMVGPVLVAAGCALSALKLDDFWIGAVGPMLLIAAGMALVVSPLTTAVMNAAPEGKSGAASSVNNAASRIAGLMAVAILGAVASLVYMSVSGQTGARFGDLASAAEGVTMDAFTTAYSVAMWCAAGLALLSAVSVFVFMRDEPTAEPQPA